MGQVFGYEAGDHNQETEKSSKSKVGLNEVILNKIGEQLPKADLQNLRSVVSVWNSQFRQQLKLRNNQKRTVRELPSPDQMEIAVREAAPLYLDFPFTKLFVNPEDGDRDRDRLHIFYGHFLDLICEFGGIFRSITSLQLGRERHPNVMPIKQLRRLIFELTPHLKELILVYEVEARAVVPGNDLNLVADNDIDTGGEDKSLQKKELPKLKLGILDVTVGFKDNDNDEAMMGPAFTQLMCDVIEAAGQLQEFHLYDPLMNSQFFLPTVTVLQNSTRASYLGWLKTLNIAQLTVPVLQILIQLAGRREEVGPSLRLNSFWTSMFMWHYNNEWQPLESPEFCALFHTFLATQSLTLKHLCIGFASSTEERREGRVDPLVIPRMERLTKLDLKVCGICSDEMEIQDRMPVAGAEGKLVDTFPELTRLCYHYHPFSINASVGQDALEKVCHPGVTHLEVQTGDSNYLEFGIFGPVFPSLTRMELNLHNLHCKGDRGENDDWLFNVKLFATKLWTTWPALTSLTVAWTANGLEMDLDVLLSGVPRIRLEQLRHKLDTLVAGGVGGGGGSGNVVHGPTLDLDTLRAMLEEGRHKLFPGIRDLAHLRDFKMTFDGNDNAQLTDMGGYFGLALASPTLQRAIIRGSGKNLVSEECAEFIKTTFGLGALIELVE